MYDIISLAYIKLFNVSGSLFMQCCQNKTLPTIFHAKLNSRITTPNPNKNESILFVYFCNVFAIKGLNIIYIPIPHPTPPLTCNHVLIPISDSKCVIVSFFNVQVKPDGGALTNEKTTVMIPRTISANALHTRHIIEH